MSFLPEISEDQRNKNIKKLINQNKKLREQIFIFQQQMRLVLLGSPQEINIGPLHQKIKESLQLQKNSLPSQDDSLKNISKSLFNKEKLSQQQIDELLEYNSCQIEKKIIRSLKEKVESLKAQNIKENIIYILSQQDQLKILKKELHNLKKEKQVIKQFLKDKCEELQKSNKELIIHKNALRQQLNSTIKFNHQQNSQITELEREVRKYHFVLQWFKNYEPDFKQSASDKSSIQKQKDLQDQISNKYQMYEDQINKTKSQIDSIENVWKPKIQILDIQYYSFKEQLTQKLIKQNEIRKEYTFQKTRIQAIRDQVAILQSKQRKKLLRPSPRLQKQLSDILKDEKQKQRKKQLYIKSHSPRDTDDDLYHQLISAKVKGSSNPQNTQNETQRDDKNITKSKNYRNQKIAKDKQMQARFSQSFCLAQEIRMQRSWTNINQLQEQNQFVFTNKTKDSGIVQTNPPHLILKNIKT